ncbi:response regulator [Dyella monticola]|nr:response regulator [Dyella monticola]
MPRTTEAVMHVLVVESDPDTRELLHYALANEGYDVSQAHSVSDALRLSRIHPDIDVVVVDMHHCRRPSSMEVAQQIRRRLRHGQYVLASGEWDALEGTCQDDTTVLRKPYGKTELLRAIGRCLLRRGRATTRRRA